MYIISQNSLISLGIITVIETPLASNIAHFHDYKNNHFVFKATMI